MKRRDTLCTLMAASAWPMAARAQPAGNVVRLGVLFNAGAPAPGGGLLERWLVPALAELGYVEGRNLQLDVRRAGGHSERLPALAADLVRARVDAIVAITNLEAFAAKAATSTIPIIVIACHGAEETGLIASYAHPGGNVTGLESLAIELDVKRLELLRATLPKARRVAVLSNPLDRGTALHRQWSKGAADALRLRLETVPVSRLEEIDAALASIAAMKPDALLLFSDSVIVSSMPRIAGHALAQRLPAFAEFRQFADAGGLMSYGASLSRMVRESARYVYKILKGATPADLPVERAKEYELVINSRTAKAFGLVVPSTVQLRADEVIE